jgi:hypothetical protein
MLDSPEGVCAGQAGSEYPVTSVPFSNWTIHDMASAPRVLLGVLSLQPLHHHPRIQGCEALCDQNHTSAVLCNTVPPCSWLQACQLTGL